MTGGDTHHYATEEHARFALITRLNSLNLPVDSLNSGLFFFPQYLISAVFESISVSYCKKNHLFAQSICQKSKRRKSTYFRLKYWCIPSSPAENQNPFFRMIGGDAHLIITDESISVFLCIYSFIQSVSLLVCRSVDLSVCGSVGLSVCQTSLSVYQYVRRNAL